MRRLAGYLLLAALTVAIMLFAAWKRHHSFARTYQRRIARGRAQQTARQLESANPGQPK